MAQEISYEMFTKAGNLKIAKLIKKVESVTSNREEAVAVLNAELKKIQNFKSYAEAGDTAVREAIAYALDTHFDNQGWGSLSVLEF